MIALRNVSMCQDALTRRWIAVVERKRAGFPRATAVDTRRASSSAGHDGHDRVHVRTREKVSTDFQHLLSGTRCQQTVLISDSLFFTSRLKLISFLFSQIFTSRQRLWSYDHMALYRIRLLIFSSLGTLPVARALHISRLCRYWFPTVFIRLEQNSSVAVSK